MDPNLLDDNTWAPSACTLPTEAQPLRVAEFDDFFTQDAVAVSRPATNQLLIEVRPEPSAAGRAADLAVRETDCCSFFQFQLTMSGGQICLTINTESAHAGVLSALGDRAEALIARTAA